MAAEAAEHEADAMAAAGQLPQDISWGPLVFEARRFVELRKKTFSGGREGGLGGWVGACVCGWVCVGGWTGGWQCGRRAGGWVGESCRQRLCYRAACFSAGRRSVRKCVLTTHVSGPSRLPLPCSSSSFLPLLQSSFGRQRRWGWASSTPSTSSSCSFTWVGGRAGGWAGGWVGALACLL